MAERELTMQELQARCALLEKQNATLSVAAMPKQGLALKVSEKGAVSIYGVGRFPITVYASQAVKLASLFGAAPENKLFQFIKANADALSFKDDSKDAVMAAIG